MSVDLGDRTEDSLIYFMWSTNAVDGSSITRATNGTISVYKNDDLTQSVAGITDTEDFDSLTGIHMCKIDTSADAFYATAEDYTVVLSGATIDGKSVNAVLAVFSIENRFMRGTDSAALASVCTNTRIAELDAANLPADIADVLTQVANLITRTKGLNDIHDDLVTAQADLDIITGSDGALLAAAATSAQLVDDVWDEILTGVTHNIVNSAGRRVREIGAYAVESGTAQAGATHSITLAATASATDGIYNRNLVVLTDNTGVGQTRTIVDYDGTSKVAVIDRDWRVAPDNTTSYQVTADNTPLVVDQGVAQDGTATTIKLRAYASSTNDTYLCNVVAIIAGTGRGQARLVGSYNGTTKVATICGDNWVTTPDTTSVYVLMPYGTTCTSCIGDYALGLINTECDTALTDYDPPTKTEMDSAFTEIKGATWAAGTDTLEHIRNKETDIETDTAQIGTAGAGLTDLGGMSTGMKAEVNAQVVDTLTVDPIADSYATGGSQPTIAQALLAIQQMMQEKSITGTTLSVKKPDGSTSAMTFTLDSATAPTSITRST